MSRKPDNHAGLRTFLNTAIPQNRKYIGKTMPGAIVAGARSTILAYHASTTVREKSGPPAPTGHRMRWANWPGLLLTSAHVYGRKKQSYRVLAPPRTRRDCGERYARNCVNVRVLAALSQAIGGWKAPARCRKPMKAATRNHSSYVRDLHPWHKSDLPHAILKNVERDAIGRR